MNYKKQILFLSLVGYTCSLLPMELTRPHNAQPASRTQQFERYITEVKNAGDTYPLKSALRYLIPLLSGQDLANLTLILNDQGHSQDIADDVKQILFLKYFITHSQSIDDYVRRADFMSRMTKNHLNKSEQDIVELRQKLDNLLMSTNKCKDTTIYDLTRLAAIVSNKETLPSPHVVYTNTSRQTTLSSFYEALYSQKLPEIVKPLVINAVKELITAYKPTCNVEKEIAKEDQHLQDQFALITSPDKYKDPCRQELSPEVEKALRNLFNHFTPEQLAQLSAINSYPFINPQDSRIVFALTWLLGQQSIVNSDEYEQKHKENLIGHLISVFAKKVGGDYPKSVDKKQKKFLSTLFNLLNNNPISTEDYKATDIIPSQAALILKASDSTVKQTVAELIKALHPEAVSYSFSDITSPLKPKRKAAQISDANAPQEEQRTVAPRIDENNNNNNAQHPMLSAILALFNTVADDKQKTSIMQSLLTQPWAAHVVPHYKRLHEELSARFDALKQSAEEKHNAAVTKYNTQLNVNADIMKQNETLAKQAELLEQHKSNFFAQLQFEQQETTQLKGQLIDQNKKVEMLRAEHTALAKESERLQAQHRQLVNELENEHNKHIQSAIQFEKTINELQAVIKKKEAEAANYHDSIYQLTQIQDHDRKELAQARQNLEEAHATYEAKKAQYEQQIALIQRSINELRGQQEQSDKAYTKLEREKERLQNSNNNLATKIADAKKLFYNIFGD